MSKKNKRAWRKHTEIGDVEKFLEERLREERTGGNPTEKENKDLFYIDKTDIFETTKSKLSNLKCHSDLQVDTRVAPVSGYSGPSKRKKKKRKTSLSCDPLPAKPVPAKTGKYDLWGATAAPKRQQDPCLQAPVKPPQQYKISDSKLPAVEAPHPGASYNPSFKEHQELLQTALEVEERREKAKIKATKDAAPPIRYTEEQYIQEMSIGLNKDEQSEEEEVTEEVADEDSFAQKPVVVQRKTRVQRNREKAEKQKAAEFAAAKTEKQLAKQLNRVRAIKREITVEERKMAAITAERQEKKEVNALRPGKYGPGKLIEEQPEFQLPEEVSSSLRKLAVPTNSIQERFLSMQKRNLIEVRKKVNPHRKYKLKEVEKWRKKLPEEILELTKMKHKKKQNKKKTIKVAE